MVFGLKVKNEKKVILIFSFMMLLTLPACVNFFPITINGTLESENPKMRIVFLDDPTTGAKPGELVQEDGTVIEIVFMASHGDFFIFEANEEGLYGTEDIILFEGECRQKDDDTLILFVDDGSKIILKKVEETSD